MIIEDGEIRYAIEDKLAKKINVFIDRCTRKNQKQNAYLANHGKTGEGKTNTSVVEAHYFRKQTGWPIHLFFNLEPMIDFAKSTENMIIIHDEPALDSLSTDQMTSLNKNFLRLVNTARKKRHFTIINITKFWRFPQDLVVDTCLGMVHMYTKKKAPGRFLYIRQKKLEWLWNDYQKYHQRNFAKYKSFGGWMPNIMEKYFHLMDVTIHGPTEVCEHATYDDYERIKDDAIKSIGTSRVSKKELKILEDIKRLRIGYATIPDMTDAEKARHMGVTTKTVMLWRQMGPKMANSLGNKVLEEENLPIINNLMVD